MTVLHSDRASTSQRLLVRAINIEDIPLVAEIHRAAYGDMPHHFTSTFPTTMLEEYYSALLGNNPYSYIAVDEAQHPVGFIVAGFEVDASQRSFVRSHKRELMKLLIVSPGFLARRLAHTLRRKQAPSNVPLRLLSIAVDPSHHNRGAGKALLSHFEQQLRASGIREYGLSVKAGNTRAVQFYENSGFELETQTADAKYYKKHLL